MDRTCLFVTAVSTPAAPTTDRHRRLSCDEHRPRRKHSNSDCRFRSHKAEPRLLLGWSTAPCGLGRLLQHREHLPHRNQPSRQGASSTRHLLLHGFTLTFPAAPPNHITHRAVTSPIVASMSMKVKRFLGETAGRPIRNLPDLKELCLTNTAQARYGLGDDGRPSGDGRFESRQQLPAPGKVGVGVKGGSIPAAGTARTGGRRS